MASIMESLRDVSSERFFILKLSIFAIPAYYCWFLYSHNPQDLSQLCWIEYLTFFLVLGFFINVTGNVINERNYVLPLNPIHLLMSATKGLMAVGPICIACYYAGNYLFSLINVNPLIDIILKIIVCMILLSTILASILLFCQKENILDSYNFKIIFGSIIELIVVLLVLVSPLTLMNIVLGFVNYFLFLLLGISEMFIFFTAVLIFFNLAIIGHYLGQVNYDYISEKRFN